MRGIARFAEYGITGGLLWFLVFLFFSINQAEDITPKSVLKLWSEQIVLINSQFQTNAVASKLNVSISESGTLERNLVQTPVGESFLDMKTTISGLLSALAIVLVFCTGLLLDLIAPSWCGTFELIYLKHRLRKKQNRWLADLLAMHPDFLHNSYSQLADTHIRSWVLPKNWQKDRTAYHCLRNFLFGYLYVNAGQTQQGPLLEKVRIWRTGRATAMSLLLLGIMMGTITITQENVNNTTQLTVSIVIPIALILLSSLVSMMTFSRMYTSILSHVYHTHLQESSEKNTDIRELLQPFMNSNKKKAMANPEVTP